MPRYLVCLEYVGTISEKTPVQTGNGEMYRFRVCVFFFFLPVCTQAVQLDDVKTFDNVTN